MKSKHRRAASIAAALLTAALLAACASPTTQPALGSAAELDSEEKLQRDMAIRYIGDNLARLHRLASQLKLSALPFCQPALENWIGTVLVEQKNGEGPLKDVYGFQGQLPVLAVTPASPAEIAGLRHADTITAIDGKPVTTSAEFSSALNAQAAGQPVTIDFLRAGTALRASVTPQQSCAYAVQIDTSMQINAYADGRRVVITQGMMNFAQTDEELALVLSHEIAHNAMRHIDAKKSNAAGGMLADLALVVLSRGTYRGSSMTDVAGRAYSQDFEAEADYAGLYIMALAGYRIDEAPRFWRKMAILHPANIKTNMSASHPSTAARMVALEATVAEIRRKQLAGEALKPNMKQAAPAPATAAQ